MSDSLPPGPPPSSPPPSGPPPGGRPPAGPPPAGPPPAGPPPTGGPSGPPPPPSGPPVGETLEYGRGGPIPPPPGARRRRGRTALLVGGGVVGLGAIGAAAFGTYWYLSTGPQPAQALPADTLAYVSLDLDPSGEQKIDALNTLKKFPAADDELDLSGDVGDIDIKKVLLEKLLAEVPCDVDYGADVEPWLGDRGAIAAVDLGEEQPSPVFVLQTTDADAAVDGLRDLIGCEGESSEEPGIEIVGDEWVLLAETPELAAQAADATADGSLADDEGFQKWTDAAGDPGIVTMYASAAAGDYLAENFSDIFMGPDIAGLDDLAVDPMPLDPVESASPMAAPMSMTDDLPDGMTDEMSKAFEDFEGMAVTIRFDGGAIEVEAAAGSGTIGEDLPAGRGAEALETLPGDTLAAMGVGFTDGWFEQVVTGIAGSLGEDPEDLIAEAESFTGLDLPDDAETLLGEALVVAVGGDLDPETAANSSDGSDVPVAVKVLGDPDEIEQVLDKIRAPLLEQGMPESLLGSSSDGDAIVIGPNESYREQVLDDGDLGDSDAYRDVVPDQDDATAVLFVDLDRVVELVGEAGEIPAEVGDNLDPLAAVGMSAWLDDDGVSHTTLRISTD